MQKIIFNNKITNQTEAILCIDKENKKRGLSTRINKNLKDILNNIIYHNGIKLYYSECKNDKYVESNVKISMYDNSFIEALEDALKDNWNLICVETATMDLAAEIKL